MNDVLKLSTATKNKLLEIKKAQLTCDDLELLEDYLRGVVSKEASIDGGVYVSDPVVMSQIIKLLHQLPSGDLQMIENAICHECVFRFSKQKQEVKPSFIEDGRDFPENNMGFLIDVFQALNLHRGYSGRGNRESRDTYVRRHFFLEVYAFFIEEKAMVPDGATIKCWFHDVMTALTKDGDVKKHLFPFVSISEYISWAEKYYPIRKAIYDAD